MSIGLISFPEGQSTSPTLNLVQQSKSATPAFVAPAQIQSPPPMLTLPEVSDISNANYTIHYNDTDEWSKRDEKEFSKLAEAKALGQATANDLKKLLRLRHRRRTAKNPMSGDEVLFHYQRRQMEAKLLKDLQDYVLFIQAPRGA